MTTPKKGYIKMPQNHRFLFAESFDRTLTTPISKRSVHVKSASKICLVRWHWSILQITTIVSNFLKMKVPLNAKCTLLKLTIFWTTPSHPSNLTRLFNTFFPFSVLSISLYRSFSSLILRVRWSLFWALELIYWQIFDGILPFVIHSANWFKKETSE